MKWQDWALFTNMTCADDSVIPCAGRTVFDILTDYQDVIYQLTSKSSSVVKFFGGIPEPDITVIGVTIEALLMMSRSVCRSSADRYNR